MSQLTIRMVTESDDPNLLGKFVGVVDGIHADQWRARYLQRDGSFDYEPCYFETAHGVMMSYMSRPG